MCYITAAYAAVTAVTTAVSVTAAEQQAAAQKSLIEQQEKLQQNQIAAEAGNAESTAAKEARAAQAQSIVAAGAAGVNLGSKSFLASLQTTAMNASQSEQMIQENERNSESASIAEADSELASKASHSTFFGAGLDIALSGASAYASADLMKELGKKHGTTDSNPVAASG
jgi:hypothetical protein